MFKFIKTFINWYKGVTPVVTKIELAWADLKETKTPEVYFLEGYDKYRNYYSDDVVLTDFFTRGKFAYEVYTSLDKSVEFVCDTDTCIVYRSEEVIRGIQ